MKKNLNIIKISGLRGLIIAGLVICCLAAGFIVFPGYVAMHIWNYFVSNFAQTVPVIGLFQGVLLWGILVASYFVFRKNKLVVCIKTPQGLSEEELKEVFADMKRQSKEDPILQSMLKAREAELKIQKPDDTESNVNSDSGKI